MQPVAILDRPKLVHRARSPSDLEIVVVHSGAGAGDERTGDGPAVLADMSARTWLDARVRRQTWTEVRQTGRAMSVRKGGSDVQLPAVLHAARETAQATEKALNDGNKVLVLGGDHSIGIGTWSGAANACRRAGASRDEDAIGLIWIDAHMDAHTPDTSPSGNWHGMAVAHLLGHGHAELRALAKSAPALRPQNVCLIGTRSFEPEEAALLDALGVRMIHMCEVNAIGVDMALVQARKIANNGTVGFGVSVDLDVFDPHEAPGVGTPVDGGIAAPHLIGALHGIGRDPDLLGLEIVEFNAARDVGGRTGAIVRRLVQAAFSMA